MREPGEAEFQGTIRELCLVLLVCLAPSGLRRFVLGPYFVLFLDFWAVATCRVTESLCTYLIWVSSFPLLGDV